MRCRTPAHRDGGEYNDAYNHTRLQLTFKHTHTHTYLFVMSDQLGLHVSRHQVDSSQDLARLQAPDGAGGVDA